jgi:DNA gyrase inhibitor GyrI
MLTTLFFVFAFLVVGFFVYLAKYSGRLRVEETRLIDAPLADVYAKVADFAQWSTWNPWLEHQRAVPVTISGTPGSKGARYAWDSERLGSGEIVLRKVVDHVSLVQFIQSHQPFKYTGRSEWLFAERDGQTEVTWRLRGRVGFFLRAFAQTVRGMIVLDFRYGLDQLAQSLESANSSNAGQHYQLDYLGIREVAGRRYIFQTYNGPLRGIAAAMRDSFAELFQHLAANARQATGQPIGVYLKTNIKLRTTVCQMGLPVDAEYSGEMPTRIMPDHRAYVVRLTGTYAALEIAWYEAMQRLRIEGFKPDQRTPPFECYMNDPTITPEKERVTELYLPVLLG